MPRRLHAVLCIFGCGLLGCFQPTGSESVGSSGPDATGGSSASGPSPTSTTTGDTSAAGLTSAGTSATATGTSQTTTGTSTSTTAEASTTASVETATANTESGSTGTVMFRRAFVTSEVFGAKLGGIEGADAKCQTAADAAGLGGTFRAWISTPTSSPSTNFVQSAEPYMRIDGVQIAEKWVRLIDGDLDAPLEVDEWGEVQNNGECGNVWTNTMRDGVPYDEDACTGWTSLTDATRLGRSDVSSGAWTEGCVQDCTKQHHLYCFEQ